MSRDLDSIGRIGLDYFGRTTASISHELKNALAIVRENAGLINDYLSLAGSGRPLDLERLGTVARRIDEQVRRADGIIKNMNRFGHSIDEPLKEVDLHEIAALCVQLSLRPAAMHQVNLVFSPGPGPATVRTAPFLVLTLMGRCLNHAFGLAAAGQTLTVRSGSCKEGGCIHIEPLAIPEHQTAGFPQSEADLLHALKAVINADAPAQRLTITLCNC